MSNITYKYGKTNAAFVQSLGAYVKHHRLQQNKSQQQLAAEAGINRTTLVELEKGKNSNLITFIQVLRALQQLHILDQFEISPQISPLLLAEMEQKKRKRAGRKNGQKGQTSVWPKSNW